MPVLRTTRQFSITLLAELVRVKVASGEYASDSEVIRDGLRTLATRDRAVESWLLNTAARADGRTGPRAPRDKAQDAQLESRMAMFGVEFAHEAAQQLEDPENYIADQGSLAVASAWAEAIVTCCESLQSFPNRGVLRDDIRPGLRVTHYRWSAIIAFAVIGQTVYVLGVFYSGQDYETVFYVY